MGLSVNVALVSDVAELKSSELTKVAAALSKQASRDFGPIWKVAATVDAFTSLEDVPADYWPVIVQRNVEDAAGFHDDENGQPFAVVEYGAGWSVTASHEVVEMLADPFGRRMRAGNLLDQAVGVGLPKRRVNYLVEVADPSESEEFGYQVNGVRVSDFYTPDFFDPVAAAGVRYSFTGAIKAPRTVLKGGYISWYDPITRHWMQLRMFKDDVSSKVPHVIDLNNETVFGSLLGKMSVRSAIDAVTRPPKAGLTLAPRSLRMRGVSHATDATQESSEARAAAIRERLAAVKTAATARVKATAALRRRR